MDFDCYVARNRLTGGFMAQNKDLRALKKHILTKADPGKNVAIFTRTTLGGEKEIQRLTVPMAKTARPTVPTKERLDRQSKSIPQTFDPIVTDKWTINAVHESGKRVKVSVRGNHWPEGMEIIISHAKNRFAMTFPNGEKSDTWGQSLTTNKLEERFGKGMADVIFNFFDVAIDLPA